MVRHSMNKGYAVGFLIVLLVVILGFYVAYSGFVSSREVLRAQPTEVLPTDGTISLPVPTVVLMATAGLPLTSTLSAAVTTTVEMVATPAVAEAVPLTPLPEPPQGLPAATLEVLPESSPAAPPSSAQPTAGTEPAAAATPSFAAPTGVAEPATQQFRLAGPHGADPSFPNCCYIYGSVRDGGGTGLEGIRVQAVNEWMPPIVVLTKGGSDLGKYDIPIDNKDILNWEIVLMDGAGTPISTKVQIQFDTKASNGYRVDWQGGP